jgi:glucose-6-phosphate 1-epimerase
MKFSLASIVGVASLSASSAFVVHPSATIGPSIVVLEASRHAKKVESRTRWIEARGGDASSVAEKSSMDAGIMKNDEGLEFVRLVSGSGASAEVYLYGGVVTSYKDAEGTEFIAVRPDAKMDGSKPISGGLSHCWPQVPLYPKYRVLSSYYNFFHSNVKHAHPFCSTYR